jgi:uncharacterized membrane protein
MKVWLVLLGWVLFGGTHIGLSSYRVRKQLVDRLGEKKFQGVYSLVGLPIFVFLCVAFGYAPYDDPLFLAWGKDSRVFIYLCDFTMLIGLVIFFCAFFNPTPLGGNSTKFDPYGITRITRHPQNVGFALFGLSHLLVNRTVADWIFYGGFIIFAYFGSVHQDNRKIREIGSELQDYVSQTSVIPFWAIITGKQKLEFGEISKKGIILAIFVTVMARILHPSIFQRLF